MRGCPRLTFLALGTGHVIPAQGTSCIFPVCDKICARNTKLQIGTISTKSKSRVKVVSRYDYFDFCFK